MKPAPPPRAFEMRSENERPEAWTPPPSAMLAGLENDPDWAFRWVNVSVQGDTQIVDQMYAYRLEQGWLPVDPKDHPLLQQPRYKHLNKDGKFVRKGQVLMKMPKRLAISRNEYYVNEDRKKRGIPLHDAAQSDSGVRGFGVTSSVKTETFIGNNVRGI